MSFGGGGGFLRMLTTYRQALFEKKGPKIFFKREGFSC